MILRLALRSLMAHPVRSLVLACGFGSGVAVMAILLGVGEVILEQARSPALEGGGDVLISGVAGQVTSARFVLSSALGSGPLAGDVSVAAPRTRAILRLRRAHDALPVVATGGIPSLEAALGDPETSGVSGWIDTAADQAWRSPDPASVLRAMDRFHPVPDAPRWSESWAEWLYFNGRAGSDRFYLTFLVGPSRPGGRRAAGVRLQLDRAGRLRTFAEEAEVDEAQVLASAPDLQIGGSRVRLDGLRYRLQLDLPGDGGSWATGEVWLDASPGRSLPPIAVRGAGNWVSGYTVPVLSGALGGAWTVDRERVAFEGGTGYHDHNWGFWEGVTWQWGQVQHEEASFVYGRVFPPAEAADPTRAPGFVAALGPEGPIGYATDLSFDETIDEGTGHPSRIVVEGRSRSLDLRMELGVEHVVVNPMGGGPFGTGLDFLQLRALYRVTGRAGERHVSFSARGSAETFRGR